MVIREVKLEIKLWSEGLDEEAKNLDNEDKLVTIKAERVVEGEERKRGRRAKS